MLHKINGFYYHYYSEVKPEGRVIMMERSKSLDGPWESQQLNHVSKAIDKEPNQGGLIRLRTGEWWFITHQGTGDWEGRAMVLLPITWIDGWPIIGKPGDDGIGNMVWSGPKPIADIPVTFPQASDEFDSTTLGPQWEWNYQPRLDKWSLTERPGFLRLHAFRPVKPGDLLKAGNTLTQRVLRTDANEATIKMEISNMTDGQQAGLCHLAKAWSTIGISQVGDTRTITMNDAGKVVASAPISATTVWLRTSWNFDGSSQYSYGIDGNTFTPIGPAYKLTWSYYRGDRLGIYCFNDKADTGFVDVDWFRYTFAKPAALK